MNVIEERRLKLEQKKNRLATEESKLKIKERKIRTRSLIEHGGLITKAGLDHLPVNTIYGALLSLKEQIKDNDNIVAKWSVDGNKAFNAETRSTIAVILKFDDEPNGDIRTFIRSHGLRFNRFRGEWYGNVSKLDELKEALGKIKYELEIIGD